MYKRLKRADVSNISLRPPVRTLSLLQFLQMSDE